MCGELVATYHQSHNGGKKNHHRPETFSRFSSETDHRFRGACRAAVRALEPASDALDGSVPRSRRQGRRASLPPRRWEGEGREGGRRPRAGRFGRRAGEGEALPAGLPGRHARGEGPKRIPRAVPMSYGRLPRDRLSGDTRGCAGRCRRRARQWPGPAAPWSGP